MLSLLFYLLDTYFFSDIFISICPCKRNCHIFHGLVTSSNGVPVEIQDVAPGYRVVGFLVEVMLERFLKQYIF